MQFAARAIIIDVIKFSESSVILDLLSKDHGRFKAFMRGAFKSKNKNVLQPGNILQVEYKSRLNDQLGNAKILDHVDLTAALLCDFTKLLSINSLCAIIKETIHVGEKSPHFFDAFDDFLHAFKSFQSQNWMAQYIELEVQLISLAGYGMDLTECGATGTTENLIYVSPKTARAICADAGKPYHSKMLELPEFLINKNIDVNKEQLSAGLKLTRFFLSKFFEEHNKKLPFHRLQLEEKI